MSELNVNVIKPYSGTTVAVTGTLDVSGTIKTYAFETITVNDTNYMGSNSFGNDGADKHNFSGSIFVTGSAAGTGALTGITIETANVSTILSASAHEGVFTIDCDGDIAFDAAGGNFKFNDTGTTQLTIDVDSTAGDIDVNLNVDGDDLVFNQYDGTEVIRFTDNGRVGIGAPTPSSILEIEGSSGDLVFEIDNNASNSANFQIQNGAGNARVDLVMNDGSTSTTLTMKNQRVGIGTTSPTTTLAVNGAAHITGSILPGANDTYDLGSSDYKWANLYTGDLHLKNDRGDWTILEESDYLCVINNATGKKFKMMLQEIED